MVGKLQGTAFPRHGCLSVAEVGGSKSRPAPSPVPATSSSVPHCGRSSGRDLRGRRLGLEGDEAAHDLVGRWRCRVPGRLGPGAERRTHHRLLRSVEHGGVAHDAGPRLDVGTRVSGVGAPCGRPIANDRRCETLTPMEPYRRSATGRSTRRRPKAPSVTTAPPGSSPRACPR